MTLQDLRSAALIVLTDIATVPRKVSVITALHGGMILSGSVLDGKAGVRMAYSKALDTPVALFLTTSFKEAEPGLTMILRHACAHGWSAITQRGLATGASSHKLCLHTHDDPEIAGINQKKIKCFTANAFVDWLAAGNLKPKLSGRVTARGGA